MDYEKIRQINKDQQERNAKMYTQLSKIQKTYNITTTTIYAFIVVIGAIAIWISLDNVKLNHQLKDITAEQQAQAQAHADDRIWYRDNCEPSNNGNTVTCSLNSELSQ